MSNKKKVLSEDKITEAAYKYLMSLPVSPRVATRVIHEAGAALVKRTVVWTRQSLKTTQKMYSATAANQARTRSSRVKIDNPLIRASLLSAIENGISLSGSSQEARFWRHFVNEDITAPSQDLDVAVRILKASREILDHLPLKK